MYKRHGAEALLNYLKINKAKHHNGRGRRQIVPIGDDSEEGVYNDFTGPDFSDEDEDEECNCQSPDPSPNTDIEHDITNVTTTAQVSIADREKSLDQKDQQNLEQEIASDLKRLKQLKLAKEEEIKLLKQCKKWKKETQFELKRLKKCLKKKEKELHDLEKKEKFCEKKRELQILELLELAKKEILKEELELEHAEKKQILDLIAAEKAADFLRKKDIESAFKHEKDEILKEFKQSKLHKIKKSPSPLLADPNQQCPPNEEYRINGSRCWENCGKIRTKTICMPEWLHGCFCVHGFLRDPHGTCVPKDQCPHDQAAYNEPNQRPVDQTNGPIFGNVFSSGDNDSPETGFGSSGGKELCE